MTDFEDIDNDASASGTVSDAMNNYLRDKFPKEGDVNDGDIDDITKRWLDDKFNTQEL